MLQNSRNYEKNGAEPRKESRRLERRVDGQEPDATQIPAAIPATAAPIINRTSTTLTLSTRAYISRSPCRP